MPNNVQEDFLPHFFTILEEETMACCKFTKHSQDCQLGESWVEGPTAENKLYRVKVKGNKHF